MSRARARKQQFYKMHSLGNDFMVIDGVSQQFTAEPTLVANWADRNRGVGFDQLLVIAPPTSPDVDFDYLIYNADGSEAEQCGNGTRCVSLLVKRLRLTRKNHVHWQSAAGLFETEQQGDQFSTSMTVPELEPVAIPIDPACLEQVDNVQYKLTEGNETYTFTPVSMGNPHAVIFVDNIFDLDVEQLGGRLTKHSAFPNQANIGFCQVMDRNFIRLRVFERGTGETQACGTGACAAVVAARLNDLVEQRVKVSLPGGKLRITWAEAGERVVMTGPATLAYKGEITTNEG